MLIGVRVKNFDIFDDDKCGLLMEDYVNAGVGSKPSGTPLLNLNAFIGRNRTGKTSYIDALKFFKAMVLKDVASASTSDDRPGFSNMVIDKDKPVYFQLYFNIKPEPGLKTCFVEYDVEIDTNVHGSPYIASEKAMLCCKRDQFTVVDLLDLKNGEGKIMTKMREGVPEYDETSIADPHTCAVKLYGGIKSFTHIHALYREISRWFFCSFSSDSRSDYFDAGNAPGGHRHLNSTGSNVHNVLTYMRTENEKRYHMVVNEINDRIPLMKHKPRLPASLEDSPDKLFLYLLLLRDSDPHTTIFIETPDKDLYHDMVDVLAEELRDFTISHPYNQVIFTTHNPYIIETMAPKEIWVFRRSFNQDVGDVEIVCAASDPVVDAMFKQGIGMGAIWYGGHLDEEDISEDENEQE